MTYSEKREFKVITLCGSIKFEEEFWEAAHDLIKQECLVLMPKSFSEENKANISEKERERLDIRHRQKIDISDAILVINKDGYIGEHTKSEIDYAKSKGKAVYYRYIQCDIDCYCINNCVAQTRLPSFVKKKYSSNSNFPCCPYYSREDK